MKEIEVKFATRFIKRKRESAIGNSLLKTLTEPITNSDDSYRRLAHSPQATGEIKIVVNAKKSRRIQLIDYAEGISAPEFEDKFEYYGADKSGASSGENVRGLFGQGISDVLFYHADSFIGSIKNGKVSICRFYEKNDRPYIKVENIPGKLEHYRKLWGIPGNGTVVEFTLNQKTPLPDFSKLAQKLGVFYMLRLITGDQNRKITLEYYKSGNKKSTANISYTPPTGTFIEHKEITFNYEGYPIKIDAELYKSPTGLDRMGDDRENGLLIYDEKNAVYDLTLFGLDNLPGTDRYYGTMKITGARQLILDKINDKSHPEELLTDSRDGFNTKQAFYLQLESVMKDWLYPIISQDTKRKANDDGNAKTNENHKKAFDALNKIHEQLIGESWGGTIKTRKKRLPKNGLEFVRDTVTLTAGKKYGLELLVDTQKLPAGSRVQLTVSTGKAMFSPKEFVVEKTDERVISKLVTIYGPKANTADTITARFGTITTSAVISIVPEQIVIPTEAMEFAPNQVTALKGHDTVLHLYVDLEKIKRGTMLSITSTNDSVAVATPSLQIPKTLWSTNGVGRIDVVVSPQKVDESAQIIAQYQEYMAEAKVDVVSRKEPPHKNPSGKFRDWDFDNRLSSEQQTVFDINPESATHGFILVNPHNPLNKLYLGENPTKASIESSQTAQLYLAELLLTEFLKVTIPEALQVGTLPRRFPDYDVLLYMAQKKHEYGPAFYDHFVTAETPRIEKKESTLEKLQKADTSNVPYVGEREAAMIRLYYGLDGSRPHTLHQIGQQYGLTRERVRQLIEKTTERILVAEVVSLRGRD